MVAETWQRADDGIVYKYGYKDFGRIPTEFIHSGYALLGITPSDNTAKLLELNNKNKEETIMTEAEIKALVSETISTYKNVESEINECKEDCNKQIAELNATIETVTAEKNEAIANSEKIQEALDECIKERDEKCKELDDLWGEMKVLREELAKAKAKERIGELNTAIATFTDEEKEYAKAEIDAFNANPVESEINSVVNKIWEGIGKKAKEDAVVAEQNSANTSIEDIFSVVETNVQTAEDVNIF
ncbi:MAG: hypothetical protein II304_03670 [Bacteroidales bacterium]|nr:hypothetical protein [Bacteroidales bacterium]